MGLFKSKKDREFERNLEIKKGFTKFKREIASLERNEREWIEKHKRAKKLGIKKDMEFIKANLKRTISMRKSLESQLLLLESAVQLKNQMESFGQFASSMMAVSTSISEIFKNTDISKVQQNFERSMAQAESMTEMMDIFLDMSQGTIVTDASNLDMVSDEEVDRLLDEVNEEPDKDVLSELRKMEKDLDN